MGILRRGPAADMPEPSVDWAAVANARGAATAPARAPPVVARKPLRVAARGSASCGIEYLDRFTQPGFQEPLIILIEESTLIQVGNSRAKWHRNQSRPRRAALASWFELLNSQAGGGHYYEDAED